MHYPERTQFIEAAKQWATIPVVREIRADVLTPVGAYLSLAQQKGAFLLESVEGGEKWARYSFVGANPRASITIRGDEMNIAWRSGHTTVSRERDPIEALTQFGMSQEAMPVPHLPRFSGGLVGAFSYDCAPCRTSTSCAC